jgi:hypothetical protein
MWRRRRLVPARPRYWRHWLRARYNALRHRLLYEFWRYYLLQLGGCHRLGLRLSREGRHRFWLLHRV